MAEISSGRPASCEYLRMDRTGGRSPTITASDYSGSTACLSRMHDRRRRHTLGLFAVCLIGLVPWMVLLALTLPPEHQVHQWRVTWVGFDALLGAAMASTAYFGWRRHRAVLVSALTTAILLICDAWFDVSLDFGTPDIWMSAGLAVFAELPLAAFLIHRVHSLSLSAPRTVTRAFPLRPSLISVGTRVPQSPSRCTVTNSSR